ncbi:MAG: hypothetical protein GY862_09945 [Gammaproteobacteria bacterium]|nr:hypothetical protein [Gammaproteobacteria bacterium]
MTDWHRLFGIILTDLFRGSRYSVELEKDLSLKQQYLDAVIIEQTAANSRPLDLPDGLDNLAKHNLLTYKSLHEPLDNWAVEELIGHYVNYRKQISPSLDELLPEEDFQLYAVSTRYPQKLAGQISLEEIRPGIYQIQYGVRAIRVLVVSRMPPEDRNALWALVSGIPARYGKVAGRYHWNDKKVSTVINQLYKLYQLEGITMPYTMEDYLRDSKPDLQELINSLPVEERLKGIPTDRRLKGIPEEELLKEIPEEKRLKGIPTDRRLKGIPEEELLKEIPEEKRLKGIPTDRRLKGIPEEELLKEISVEKIEAWLIKLKQT